MIARALWLPVLLSAVAVFVLSSLIHMFTKWHAKDYVRVPDEDGVLQALRPFRIPPGEYMLPDSVGGREMRSPEFQRKLAEGPVLMMSVWPNGMMKMGRAMAAWFVYVLVVSAAVACLACLTVPRGADYHRVFHVTAFTAFLTYVGALWPASIWFHKPWGTTLRAAVDGLLYAIVTGLIFVWLWPAAM